MSKEVNFTEIWLKKIKAPEIGREEFRDKGCKGLILRVTANDVKTFSYPFRLGGKTGRVTLGRYPDYGLRTARLKTEELRGQIASGVNPLTIKENSRKAEELTVQRMASEFIELYSKPRNKSWKQADSNLKLYLISVLGNRPIHEVRRRDIHSILDDLTAEKKFTTCNRALAHMKRFFGWLVEREYLEHSPVDRIKPRHVEQPRERVLSDDEIKAIWKSLDNMSAPYRDWIKLLFLCGQREEETAGLRRGQLEKDIWVLGSEDTKNKTQSTVPLTRQSKAIIDSLSSCNQNFLLSTGRIGDRPINGFSRAKRKIDRLSGIEGWRWHDIRRTVSTNLAKLGYDIPLIKRIINHKDAGVTAIYNRYSYLEEKRSALQAWANKLDDITKQ
tara:strand:+ start:328 stop:1488 length:1161 start_codon:yes stop_codon:yes gene_type:complete